MKHMHYPNNAESHGYDKPWENGTRSVCGSCRREIRFVIGFELRRDYWTLAQPKRRAA